jgi:phosphoribosylanthranilate isomerase
MIVQIYEIQSPDEAEKMAALGVDHIGSVVLSESNWRVPLLKETVQAVRSAGAKSSLIPLFSRLETILHTLDYYRPDIVHFCQTLTSSNGILDAAGRYVKLQQQVKERFPDVEVMRTIPIALDGRSAKVPTLELAGLFEPVSDYFLTDTLVVEPAESDTSIDRQQPVAGFVGITGRCCDWQMARQLVKASRIPVILAGGIGPDNVARAIDAVRPAGVDSCTGTNAVDADGRPIRFQKDTDKVRAMVQTVRGAQLPHRKKGRSNPC